MTLEIVPLFQTLVLLSFKAALLILAILLVRAVIGNRLHPAWRHAMWGLVPLQLLLCFSIPSSWSFYNLLPRKIEWTDTVFFETQRPDFDFIPEESFETVVAEPSQTVFIESDGNRSVTKLSFSFIPTFSQALMMAWGLGCSVIALIFLRQMLLCRRWMREAEQVENEPVLHLFKECAKRMNVRTWLVLAESRCVSGPLLIGAIRPTLLLPHGLIESATPQQLRTVFLHELAHLKRWDVWTGWGMTILLAVHWFNPLLWLAVRKMNADREEACDAMAFQALDPEERPSYSYALVDIAQHFVTPARTPGLVGISDCAHFNGGKNLKRRIEMIGQNSAWKFHWKVIAASLTLLLGLVLVTDAREPIGMAQMDKTMESRVIAALPGSYLGGEGDDGFGIVIGKPTEEGEYPVTFYEDGLPGRGHDPVDDDRYQGTAKPTPNGLSVTVTQKFDGSRKEPVEQALRKLDLFVSYTERSDAAKEPAGKIGGIMLEIEKNKEWNAVKVMRDLPEPLPVPAVAGELPRKKDRSFKRIAGSYLGNEGDDRFGIEIGKPSEDGVYPITMFEDGLPKKGYNPDDDDRYEGTVRLQDGKLDIRLTKKFDGRKEERVERVLQSLTAVLEPTDDETNAKGFYLTIPKNREWDAIRVDPVSIKPEIKPIASVDSLVGDYLGWEDDDRIGIRIGRPANPNEKYPITVYENGLPGKGHDPNDDDRYEGTASYTKGILEIELLKKFDENFEEPVERALRKLTATVGLENDKATLFIPGNREWDDVKVTKISE